MNNRANDLVIENLDKNFGTVKAVDSVTLTVKAGQLTTLLGPSGCGKTTTLNIIAGLEQPDAGLVRVGDLVLNDSAGRRSLPPEARQLGMVFQSYALWPHMTVYDNLDFGLRLRKIRGDEARKRITQALDLVGLGEMAGRYPFQLSGGQQQRVALARAVVTQPRLLLLDEPLSNLDAKVREQARVWLRELQQRLGITTVYVTHDQSEALAISDMVAVMAQGRLQQYAPPNTVYETPVNRFVADFIGASAFLTGAVADQTDRVAHVALTGGYRLTANTNKRLTPGAPVDVGIRSERVQVIPDAGHRENTVEARILSSIYLGAKWQHEVETEAGRLKVETLDPAPGQVLSLYLPPEAVILFPADGTK